MNEFTIEVGFKDGSHRIMKDYELQFFFAKNLYEKGCSIFPLMPSLLRHSPARSFFLLAKGGSQIFFKANPLSSSEREELNAGIFGKMPTMLIVKSDKKNLYFTIGSANSLSILEAITQCIISDQYKLLNSDLSNKVVIDAGANFGAFSIFAASLGAKKVYAFEPVAETRRMLEDNIALNNLGKKIQVIGKALGEKAGHSSIHYVYAGDGCASIDMAKIWQFKRKIKIIRIDDFMRGRGRADFIKMDVEGYEEKVLLGAKETIKKYKPTMSFSAYHRSDDKIRLPKILKSIRQDYQCTLNHSREEDFYCV